MIMNPLMIVTPIAGNLGCQTFKGGTQNKIDFWPKSISSKEIIEFRKLT